MRRIEVVADIAAPVERVWRALTVPEEVTGWDGSAPLDVPDGYPSAGDKALWRSPVGPLRVVLQDNVQEVEPPSHLRSTIVLGFARIEEDYRLRATTTGCNLVCNNQVRFTVPGSWLWTRLLRSGIVASIARLKEFCEES